jgi:quercetin dioxygenase-like cupin family protein
MRLAEGANGDVMHIRKAGDGESVDRSDQAIFQGGSVWARALTPSEEGGDFNVNLVQFAPGARTRPHRHTSDQVLYVVSGIGKVGAEGEEHVISTGDTILIPADTEHWHGAADTTSPMSHISFLASDSETTLSD